MIRLAMLTYNEAHNLPELATSLSNIIDDVVILDDDRTTDNTAGIAQGLWYGKCTVYKSTLLSFADERNKLLSYAREGLTDQDYILIIDPDDRPTGSIPADLSSTLYFCTYISGTQEWLMPILLRADYPFSYEGAAHELLKTGDEIAILLPDFQVHRHTAGASPERKQWSIDLLSKEPDNPRSVFYLGRLYQDAGRFPEALTCFMRRSNMESKDQSETYYALFCAALIAEKFDKSAAELYCRRAILQSPAHKEPYYLLAHIYNEIGQYNLALETADEGISLPPCSDIMFVDRWVESIGIFIERHTAMEALGLKDLVVANG